MKTAERDEVKGLGLLESLQAVWHGPRIIGATPLAEDPLIAKNAMNGAQPGELRLGLRMDEWATCHSPESLGWGSEWMSGPPA